jgi:predicted nucleotidyltransferase component of viral defense system
MLQEWFDSFNCKTLGDVNRAKREMVQCIVLAGLSRSNFFEFASFFGGTALRILYNLPRFSEDLDFSLKVPDPDFTLEKYFSYIKSECDMYNMNVSLSVKTKQRPNSVESAFLKEKTLWAELTLNTTAKTGLEPDMRIKFEIERNPPPLAVSEQKVLLRPFTCYISAYAEEYLFAGKMHAVIYRAWASRVKGRDWYDLEWFIRRGTSMHLKHFEQRAKQSGNLDKQISLTAESFMAILSDRINRIDFEACKEDIARFIFDDNELNIWSTQYFHDLTSHIKFV